MYTNYPLCTRIIIITFLILCTYFFTNVFMNRGSMSDIEFYVAFVFLMLILAYIYNISHHEGFTDEPESLRISNELKTLYDTITSQILYKYEFYKPKIIVVFHEYKVNINNKIKNILTYLKHGHEN